MESTVQSKQRFILGSHRKFRRVINEVRGLPVLEAYNILRFMPYRHAKIVLKHLKNAIHNAEQKFGEDLATPENMVVSAIMADEGPAYRRFRPRAQGRVYRIEKPTTHLTVQVKVNQKAEEQK